MLSFERTVGNGKLKSLFGTVKRGLVSAVY